MERGRPHNFDGGDERSRGDRALVTSESQEGRVAPAQVPNPGRAVLGRRAAEVTSAQDFERDAQRPLSPCPIRTGNVRPASARGEVAVLRHWLRGGQAVRVALGLAHKRRPALSP